MLEGEGGLVECYESSGSKTPIILQLYMNFSKQYIFLQYTNEHVKVEFITVQLPKMYHTLLYGFVLTTKHILMYILTAAFKSHGCMKLHLQ